jgi:hypothetical protein
MNNRGLHKRGLVSLLTLSGFLMMTITGAVLYITPRGRIAYWTDWKLLTLTKEDWVNIHILSLFLFVTAVVFHIYYNWTPLVRYIMDKMSNGLRLKKEMEIALSLCILIFVSALYRIPPLQYFIDLNETVKRSWITTKEYEPPFGHAEQLSLTAFTKKMGIDFDDALTALESQGVKVNNAEYSLKNIARSNDITPMTLYTVIRKFARTDSRGKMAFSYDAVPEQLRGKGLGKMTLPKVCETSC